MAQLLQNSVPPRLEEEASDARVAALREERVDAAHHRLAIVTTSGRSVGALVERLWRRTRQPASYNLCLKHAIRGSAMPVCRAFERFPLDAPAPPPLGLLYYVSEKRTVRL